MDFLLTCVHFADNNNNNNNNNNVAPGTTVINNNNNNNYRGNCGGTPPVMRMPFPNAMRVFFVA